MDKIFFNGIIRTMDDDFGDAQAVAVKNGIIIRVGCNEEILSLKSSNTELIDLCGKTMLPGFIDTHMHLIGCGFMMERLNLGKSVSINHLIEQGKKWLELSELKDVFWLQGRGWNNDYWEDTAIPTKHDLDKISLDIPICFVRVCGHMCVLNSKALEVCGVNSGTKINGGSIGIGNDGLPNGALYENAVYIAYEKFPSYDLNDVKRMIKKASELAVSKGITSVHTDDFETLPGKNYKIILDAYSELAKNNEMRLRVNQQCLFSNIDDMNNFFNTENFEKYNNQYFKLCSIKILADGSLGARTAYLKKPYNDDSKNRGMSYYSQSELDELIITAHRNNVPCSVHCIGDAAIDMVMNSIEKAQILYPKLDIRHGIVHCQITDKMTLDRLKALKLIAYIQPIFINYDLHIVEKRVGKKLASTSYNWKTMVKNGVSIACGSDAPIENFDILPNIYTAVVRKDLNGFPPDGWFSEQCLTVKEAVYGFTMGAAYASYDENIKGSVTAGKLADLVVLNEDIFEIDKEGIKDVLVYMTVVDGKIVYINN